MIKWLAKQAGAWARRRFDNKAELTQALFFIAGVYGSLDLYGIWFAGRMLISGSTWNLLKGAYWKRRKHGQ